MEIAENRLIRHVSSAVVWSALAPAGVCIYLAGFAVPFEWPSGFDLPLALLAGCAAAAVLLDAGRRGWDISRIFLPVVSFLAVTAISIGASRDPALSFRLSAALLPGAILYFVISTQIHDLQKLRWIIVVQSLLALGLGLSVLRAVWQRHGVVPHGFENWMTEAGSPILVVTNDAAFLAILAPLSLALLLAGTRTRAIQALAAASVAVSVVALVLIQSRVALLTLTLSVTVVVGLLRPRWVVRSSITTLAVVAIIDGLRGFPLLGRFALLTQSGSGMIWDARFPIWSSAWTVFLKHPWLGQGPHTFSYTSPHGIQVSWVHNLWLEILAEQGIVGFLVFVWLMGAAAWVGMRTARQATGARRAFAAGTAAALIAFGCGAMFDFSFLRQWVAVVVFVLVGTCEAVGKQDMQMEETK